MPNKSDAKFSVSVVGASGYAGGEVLRTLNAHPNIEILHLMGATSAGTKVIESHPELQDLHMREIIAIDIDKLLQSDVIFLCLPHGKSGEIANALDDKGFGGIILDIGADFRLESAADWESFYGSKWQGAWTYGLPELRLANGTYQRELLQTAKRIAVPGCNVTAVTLALQPALTEGIIDPSDIVAVLANGYSGAGKALQTHLLAAESIDCAKPYAVGGVHRHIPEILQNMRKVLGENAAQSKPSISFTPTLVPMVRGILATVTAKFVQEVNQSELQSIYEKFYANEEFIKVLPVGLNASTVSVKGTNYAHLQVSADQNAAGGQDGKGGRAVIVAAIDNLVRGTAGQAVQSLNLALGLFENTGLTHVK